MKRSGDERGAAAYDFAGMRVEVEAMIDQDLEYGDGLGGAGGVVEVVIYGGVGEAETLGEAPGKDGGVAGFDGLEGDGVEEGSAGGKGGEVRF